MAKDQFQRMAYAQRIGIFAAHNIRDFSDPGIGSERVLQWSATLNRLLTRSASQGGWPDAASNGILGLDVWNVAPLVSRTAEARPPQYFPTADEF